MGIEAHSPTPGKPFTGARDRFEQLIAEVSSPEAWSLTHSELEGLLHARGLELMRQLLQDHVDLRGPGEALDPVRTRDGVVLTHQRGGRARHWESIFGTIALTRVGYAAHEEAMAYPLDGDLNLPPERYTLGVRRRVAKEVPRGSFDEAVDTVEETTGAHVPKRQAEELTVRAARDFEAFYAQTEGRNALGPILALSVDGKGVVMRKTDLREPTRQAAERRRQKLPGKRSNGEKSGSKRMATVAAVYTVAPYVRTPEQVVGQIMETVRLVEPPRPRPEGKRVWASLVQEPDEVITTVFEEARRRDPDTEKSWVAVVDGNEHQLQLLD